MDMRVRLVVFKITFRSWVRMGKWKLDSRLFEEWEFNTPPRDIDAAGALYELIDIAYEIDDLLISTHWS